MRLTTDLGIKTLVIWHTPGWYQQLNNAKLAGWFISEESEMTSKALGSIKVTILVRVDTYTAIRDHIALDLQESP